MSWWLPACARAADLGCGLARKSCGGWGVGIDATALTWDCPKPTDLIRITPIISLSLCPYFPPLNPLPPFSLLYRPRICCLPLSCCSFSCSSLTTPSRTYSLTKKQCSHWLVCSHGDHSCHFFSCH